MHASASSHNMHNSRVIVCFTASNRITNISIDFELHLNIVIGIGWLSVVSTDTAMVSYFSRIGAGDLP